METILLKIAPILLIFLLGIILRKTGIFSEESAEAFLKFVFYVSFPASILTSVPKIHISMDLVFLPVSAAAMIIISFIAAKGFGKFFHLSMPTVGVFLVGSMIINTGFIYPFIIAVYGQEGFARATLFDMGNALLVLTFVYYIAIKYSGVSDSLKVVKKLFGSSPLWALLIALILNYTNLKLPLAVNDLLITLSYTLIPLFMISLGIHFRFKVIHGRPLISAIFIRMFLGLLLGFAFVWLFGLTGLNRQIVLLSSAAPVGLSTLTFATMEKLDIEFAASLVSISILIGIFLTPALIFII